MKWYGVWCLTVVMLLVTVGVEQCFVAAAPSPRSDDLLKKLQNLEQMYSSMARPSVRSGPAFPPDISPKVQRAINMLRIQHLERLFQDRSRPRFGKRFEVSNSFPSAAALENVYAKWRRDQLVSGDESQMKHGNMELMQQHDNERNPLHQQQFDNRFIF